MNPNHLGPQVTDASSLGIVVRPDSQIGVRHHISSLSANVGGFDVMVTFTDATRVTVCATGPDWFGGTHAVPPRQPGVASQTRLGGGTTTWPSVENNDSAATSPVGNQLSVFESVLSVPQLILDGFGSHVNKTIASIPRRLLLQQQLSRH